MRTFKIAISFLIFVPILLNSCKKEETIVTGETLLEKINSYRAEHNLPEIPISPSLSYVAETHASDLIENYVPNEECNIHSWSDKGNWTPVCYKPDHSSAPLMWIKPSELTSYTSNGYEIAVWSSDSITADKAIELWQSSPAHNDMILNRNSWRTVQWKAMGGTIKGTYALVWFGEEEDFTISGNLR